MAMFLLLNVFLILADTVDSQVIWPRSIYEVGKPIRSSEDNFINLSYNWNEQNVSNSNELKILKFEFSQIIGDESKKRAYLDSLQSINYPFPILITTTASDKKNSYCELFLKDWGPDRDSLDKSSLTFWEGLNEAKKKFFESKIHYGTKVYYLFLEKHDQYIKKKYRLFVFIDPCTNRVIEDFFFTVIPLDFLYDKPQLEVR